jgi:prepilin-type processing-associated H-X9-DG protein
MNLSAALALLALGQGLPSSMNKSLITLADGSAIALAPPICYVSPMVEGFEWSPNGRWLLVRSLGISDFDPLKPSMPRDVLTLVDVIGRKSTVLHDRPPTRMMSTSTFAGDDLILTVETQQIPSGPNQREPGIRSTAVLKEAGGKQSWQLYDSGIRTGDDMRVPWVLTAPKYGYAVILDQTPTGEGRVTFANIKSNTRKPLAAGYMRFEHDADGYLGQQVFKDRRPNGQFERIMPDGTISTVPFKPQKEASPAAFRLMNSAAVHKIGKKSENVAGWWLASNHPSDFQFAIAVTDADRAELSPDAKSMAYLTDGNLFVRQIIPLSKTDFEELLIREEQNELMNKAKQMATAIAIYCADSDDVFPAQEGFADKILPYVKSRSLMDGFTYTFSAKSATEIAEPSKTEIGYAQGRRGRAVAYADGHVRWFKNP